ncbi:flagellar hook-basal body complex protein FliE [Tenuibacillus multivorans]|uniref:Flagellar hook-basal body complex protein FliE n=1 Tax=Tenuibacillus multivorans TaxID=237069 RepID=A0A1G9Y0B9_9BACI|nr:flagellar hook-basal body complex protein FliE [Tenuibacillus multivorans]GEL75882.1 hypothetical protein TMU01_01170 [Tenuibacillus multivorans]SDN02091.1 flagellar hook-basal body complex protein FliE [Tenuibacillus multivorans]
MEPINPLFLKTDIKAVDQNMTNQLSPSDRQQQFSTFLKDAINQVNEAKNASDQKTNALINGEVDNLHDVMITAQKASIQLQTANQIQSKAIEAYKQVMRMQL